jgi:type IV secretory pathway TraG/TraD family ATPase VirD4
LPSAVVDIHSRWFRLLVSSALDAMMASEQKPPFPVLFMLDEFAQLGHLASVEQAMSLAAGYGVQLWPVVQDIHQRQLDLKDFRKTGMVSGYSGISIRDQIREEPLLSQGDVLGLSRTSQILFAAGVAATFGMDRRPYWQIPALAPFADENPYHPKPEQPPEVPPQETPPVLFSNEETDRPKGFFGWLGFILVELLSPKKRG